MTVSSQTSTATFVGNGVATAFPLPFRFFDNGDIRAYFIDSVTGAATQMVLGSDYTLIGAGAGTGADTIHSSRSRDQGK